MENKSGNPSLLRALPLLWLSITFLAGILFASLVAVSLWVWLPLSGLAAAATIAFRKHNSWTLRFFLAAACILFLGAARYQVSHPVIDTDNLAYYNDTGSWVEIRGILEQPVVQKDGYIELFIRAENIQFQNGESQQVTGLLLARTEYRADLNYGDRLLLSGELITPPVYEDFSYRDYLARQSIYALMPFGSVEKLESGRGNPLWAALYVLRERGVETLYRIYPAREASLLAGILLGDESGLSENMKLVFNETGTRHIIAISGFNISIIAGFFLALFGRWLGARRGAWAAGIGIGLYTLLVGADTSVVRAAIMGILTLFALQTGRQSLALNSLGFSAALMTLMNPLVLWDIGFQLSFAATLGLVLYSEPLRARVDRWLDAHLLDDLAKRISRPINDYLVLTVAAQIITLPILLYYFHRLSIFSLPANLLILPAQPALMVLGGSSVLAGIILLPLGQLVGTFGWALAAYTIRIVEFFGNLPWASQSLSSFPLILVLLYFAFLAVISIPALRQRIRSFHIQPVVGLVALAAVSFWTWNAALAAPDGRLSLALLDAQGEALLIRTPDGRHMLINTGGSANDLLDSVSLHIPFRQNLDWIILAGRRQDQIGGISGALERLSPEAIGWAIRGFENQVASIGNQAPQENIQSVQLQPGDFFDLGSNAQLEVVAVGKRGAVLLINWQNFQALLPLGLDFDQMEDLNYAADIGPMDLLLLADSGYPPLNPPEWISNLSPTVIWVSANAKDSGTQTMIELGDLQAFRTDRNGWLQVITDGQQMWLEVERP